MAVLAFRISEEGRVRLGTILAVVNGFMAFFGTVMIVMGIYIKDRIESRLVVLEDYNSGTLPYMLISVGAILIVINGIGAKICYDCGSYETRERFQSVLLLYILLIFVISWVVMSAACLCFTHRGYLEEAFKKGLLKSMMRYKAVHSLKLTIDELQMDYQCCGSKGYWEWFTVSWIENKYVDVNLPKVASKLKEGHFYTDSAPFSCCNPASFGPCVHHNVAQHLETTGRKTTLYEKGCSQALIEYFENVVLTPCGIIVFVGFGLEWVVLILTRYLQTSIDNAYKWGTPMGESPGWLMEYMPCRCLDENQPDMMPRKHVQDQDVEAGMGGDGGGGGGGFEDFAGGFGGGGGEDGDDKTDKRDEKKGKGDNKKDKKGKEKKGKEKKGKEKKEKGNKSKKAGGGKPKMKKPKMKKPKMKKPKMKKR